MVDRVRVLNKGLLSTVTQQWRIQERDPGDPASPPLFLDQTKAPRAEKKAFKTAPLPFISGS